MLRLRIVGKGDKVIWTIPCFPVMDISFGKVTFEGKDKIYNGLMKLADLGKNSDLINANIVCWRSCNIDIEDVTYVVLWEWEFEEVHEEHEAQMSDISHVSESSLSETDDISDKASSSDPEEVDRDIFPPITHTLPFKVIGVTHTKTYQNHLEKALLKLSENECSVTAHIMPEPDNERDSEAICVKIDYGEGQVRVGYIARELTKYIHPLFKQNKILKVRIGKIKFQTQWLRIGFYTSILITRNGEWEKFVENAARHVKLY